VRAHVRDERAANKMHADEIYVQYALEVGRRLLPKRRHRSKDAGVIDKDINAAKIRDRCFRSAFDARRVGDVDTECQVLLAKRPNRRFGCVAIDVPDGHAGTFTGKTRCNGQTDAARSARHNGRPASKPLAGVDSCTAHFGRCALV
jgi:hypothetical protein